MLTPNILTKEAKAPKILIVDDREYDRILYKEYLDGCNYVFDELDDGDLVMNYLTSSIPDVIILDWQMSRMDGVEVLKLLRYHRNYKHIPIVVITGQESIEVLETAFDYGCSDFLIKPVNQKELKVRIQNALRQKDKLTNILSQNSNLEELNQLLQKNQDPVEHRSVVELNKAKSLLLDLKEKMKVFSASNGQKNISGAINEIDQFLLVESERPAINADQAFNKKLLSICPSLTTLDLQHCNLIRNNLSNQEIAELLFVEIKSLQTTRYRIKKKIGLEKNINLKSYLLTL